MKRYCGGDLHSLLDNPLHNQSVNSIKPTYKLGLLSSDQTTYISPARYCFKHVLYSKSPPLCLHLNILHDLCERNDWDNWSDRANYSMAIDSLSLICIHHSIQQQGRATIKEGDLLRIAHNECIDRRRLTRLNMQMLYFGERKQWKIYLSS